MIWLWQALLVNLWRAQTDWRSREHHVQSERANPFNLFASSAANRSTAAEKERHVAAKLSRQIGQAPDRPIQTPSQIGCDQAGCRVARGAAQARRGRYSLDKA